MAIEKVYRCDLCGEYVVKADVRRAGVRTFEDRAEDADWLDVGPCCRKRELGELLDKAAEQRRITEHGD